MPTVNVERSALIPLSEIVTRTTCACDGVVGVAAPVVEGGCVGWVPCGVLAAPPHPARTRRAASRITTSMSRYFIGIHLLCSSFWKPSRRRTNKEAPLNTRGFQVAAQRGLPDALASVHTLWRQSRHVHSAGGGFLMLMGSLAERR